MAQSLAKVYVHAVFVTKNRKELIDPDIERELYPYMATIFRKNDSPCLTINGTGNHVHVLFVLSRKATIRNVIENVKKCSSKWIKTKGPEYRNFYWQSGSGVFSVGSSNLRVIKKYIKNQKEHHQQKTFRNEYIQLLTNYNMAYDKRYVWK